MYDIVVTELGVLVVIFDILKGPDQILDWAASRRFGGGRKLSAARSKVTSRYIRRQTPPARRCHDDIL